MSITSYLILKVVNYAPLLDQASMLLASMILVSFYSDATSTNKIELSFFQKGSGPSMLRGHV